MAEAKERNNGATVKDVPAHEFIVALAQHFKRIGKMELPKWHDIVKTSLRNELSPYDPDWYYIRAASIARKVYLRGGTGVGAFTKVYGGRYRRGARPNIFQKASKGIIRHILQQLAEIDYVGVKADRKGRWLTKNGQKELDTIASQIRANTGAPAS